MNSLVEIADFNLSETASFNNSPIAIGGVGGSGTRLVAGIAKELGVFMGSNVNVANDNLEFVKSRKILLDTSDALQDEILTGEFQHFEKTMHENYLKQDAYSLNWGWKVPGQFHLLRYTSAYFPELKYIHVIRHGLDMAFSKNKNQLRNWGPYLGINSDNPDDPASALDYWISANDTAIEEGTSLLGDRFLLLNFDQLCHSMESTINRLSQFITGDHNIHQDTLEKLYTLVQPPKSLNRYRSHDYQTIFQQDAINAVKRLGFSV